MADEPINLVLVQLRDIRATLDEHSTQFRELKERLNEVDRRLARQHIQIMHALGLITDANLASDLANEGVEKLEHRLSDLTTRVAALEGAR